MSYHRGVTERGEKVQTLGQQVPDVCDDGRTDVRPRNLRRPSSLDEALLY